MTITVLDSTGTTRTIQTADDIVTALGSVATQTTLAAVLAKLSSDPATQTTLAAVLTALQNTLAVSAASLPLPTGAATAANQSTGNTSLASILSALQGTLTTKQTRASTGTTTSVSASATSVTLLASNTNRLGATIYNDSSALLYVKFGATASTTSFTALLAAGDYYEVPANYTGIIDGIWSAANGAARITELT